MENRTMNAMSMSVFGWMQFWENVRHDVATRMIKETQKTIDQWIEDTDNTDVESD